MYSLVQNVYVVHRDNIMASWTHRIYPTGRGVKACPQVSQERLQQAHVSASREDISQRLKEERATLAASDVPDRKILQTTSALMSLYTEQGCGFMLDEATDFSPEEREERDVQRRVQDQMQRGYPLPPRCEGRLRFHNVDENPTKAIVR